MVVAPGLRGRGAALDEAKGLESQRDITRRPRHATLPFGQLGVVAGAPRRSRRGEKAQDLGCWERDDHGLAGGEDPQGGSPCRAGLACRGRANVGEAPQRGGLLWRKLEYATRGEFTGHGFTGLP